MAPAGMTAPGPAAEGIGRCCRVWLPDLVLPAGERLCQALEGPNGTNFVHLRKKHPTTTFKVFGAASVALPPWKRLQVMALCSGQRTLDEVEKDVLDLAETACDVVADALNLTDDQVQFAFDAIRVERHDMKLPTPVPAPPPATPVGSPVAASGLQAKAVAPSPINSTQLNIPSPPPGLQAAPLVNFKIPTAHTLPPDVAPAAPRVRSTPAVAVPPAAGKPSPPMPAPLAAQAPAQPAQAANVGMLPPASATNHKRKRPHAEAEDAKERPRKKLPVPKSVPQKKLPVPDTEGTSGSTSSEDEEDESDEDGDAPPSDEATFAEAQQLDFIVPPAKLQLFKLGQLCCDVIARYVDGNQKPGALAASLQIDQRSTIERCREHKEWGGKLTTIWRFSLAAKRGQAAYDALASYFVAKQRVGLVEVPGYTIYVVPPDEKYLKALGLAASKYILAVQVPAVQDTAAAE